MMDLALKFPFSSDSEHSRVNIARSLSHSSMLAASMAVSVECDITLPDMFTAPGQEENNLKTVTKMDVSIGVGWCMQTEVV